MAALRVSSARWQHLRRLAELSRKGSDRSHCLVVPPHGWSPIQETVLASPPLPGLWPARTRTLALLEADRVVAYGQARTHRAPERWDIVQLAVEGPGRGSSEGATTPQQRVVTLLGGIVEAAEGAGVARLFARLPAASESAPLFRQAGFARLLTEYACLAPARSVGPPPAIVGLRPQQRADSFPLWQLYRVSTPLAIQSAEGHGSRNWDLPAASALPWLGYRFQAERFVVGGPEGRPVAWLRLALKRQEPSSAQLMIDPTALDLVDTLLDFALARAAAAGGKTVAFALREYQSHLRAVLEARGFRVAEASDLFVNRLALVVPQPVYAPALEKVAT